MQIRIIIVAGSMGELPTNLPTQNIVWHLYLKVPSFVCVWHRMKADKITIVKCWKENKSIMTVNNNKSYERSMDMLWYILSRWRRCVRTIIKIFTWLIPFTRYDISLFMHTKAIFPRKRTNNGIEFFHFYVKAISLFEYFLFNWL